MLLRSKLISFFRKLILLFLVVALGLSCIRMLILGRFVHRFLLSYVDFVKEVEQRLVKLLLGRLLGIYHSLVVHVAWRHLSADQHGQGLELSRLCEVDRVTVSKVFISDGLDLCVLSSPHVQFVVRMNSWW